MINSIVGSHGISVMPGSSPYVTQTGVVRWNGNRQQLEVMDHSNWIPLSNGASWMVSPDTNLNNVMNWAMIKMAEEQQLKVLMDKHPGLKDTKEKFDIMLALVRNGEFTEDK